jgi:hypothetical protein
LLAWALGAALPVVAPAAEPSPDLARRYSAGAGSSASQPSFTLLDPTWQLPPIESVDIAAAMSHAALFDDRLAHAPTQADEPPAAPAPGTPLTYSLAAGVSAQLRYRHSFLFETAPSNALRDEGGRSFSLRPDRDVVGLNMSWHLAGSTVGVGYQIESARENAASADGGLYRFMPGSLQATHAFTLGLTREWGAPEAPQPIEAPVVSEAGEPPPKPGETPTPGREKQD